MPIINYNGKQNEECVRVTRNLFFYRYSLLCLFFVKKQRQDDTNKNAKISVFKKKLVL